MCIEPERTLESEVPPEFVEWAAYTRPGGRRTAEVLEEAICRLRFENLDFLTDVVTAWRRHADQGCDGTETTGKTRAKIQRAFVTSLQLSTLPTVPAAFCKRIVTIATNYAKQGMSMKATKDTLLYRYIERTLQISDLAAIPYTAAPYEANSSNPAAERIIKEITTDRDAADIISSCEPSTSQSEAFALLLYTALSEMWNGEAPECHVNTNVATAQRLCFCIFTEMMEDAPINMGLFDPDTNILHVVDDIFPVPSLIYHMVQMAGEDQLLSIIEGRPDSARYAAARYAIES